LLLFLGRLLRDSRRSAPRVAGDPGVPGLPSPPVLVMSDSAPGPQLVSATAPPVSAALALGKLLLTSNEWVHRRIENVAFTDDVPRRRVSVDFTLPDWVPPLHATWIAGTALYAPLAILAKNPLTSFDLRDEAGRALPMPTRQQNGEVAAAVLIAAIQQATGTTVPADVRKLAWQVAIAPKRAAEAAARQLLSGLSLPGAVGVGVSDPGVERLAYMFARGFMVLVRVENPSERRIVKFSYLEALLTPSGTSHPQTSWRSRLGLVFERLAVRLGWRPVHTVFEIPDAGSAASYHFELSVARDLELIAAGLAATNGPKEVKATVPRLPQRRIHMYVEAPPGSEGLAWGSVRAQRLGLLRAALLQGGLTIAVLVGAGLAARSIATSPATTSALLLAVPGALAAYLSRPDDHPLTTRLRGGTRMLILASGLCAFAGAAVVALDPATSVLRNWLFLLAVLAADVFLLLVVTYVFPLASENKPADA
jgi:hypothetical protein